MLKNILSRVLPKSDTIVFTAGASDPTELPNGFFRCRIGERETVGYHDKISGFLCYRVGASLSVNCGRIVRLEPKQGESLADTIAALQLVVLHPFTSQDGVHHIGGSALLDTWAERDADNWHGEAPRTEIARV